MTDPIHSAARALIDAIGRQRLRRDDEADVWQSVCALRAALDAPSAPPSERDRALVLAGCTLGEPVESAIAKVDRAHPAPDTRALCLRVAEAVLAEHGPRDEYGEPEWSTDKVAAIVDRVLRGAR